MDVQSALDPPARARCLATLDSLASLLEVVDAFCSRHGIDHDSAHDLHLIAEEACMNVISHAYPASAPGPLTLQLRMQAHPTRPAVALTVEDHGMPFNPLALPAPDARRPLAERPVGGLGVMLIRRLSHAQHYTHDPARGNALTVLKVLPPIGGAPHHPSGDPRGTNEQ
ncbi:ATP-binding protein [Ramlibacter sp. AN1015]|uniref:ATP-binding protein n=1 Tax=Ramlibacter sp. AN1015 TaxID=3133428 RepID=UPI0030BA6B32